MSVGGTQTSYSYDWAGRRVLKQVNRGATTVYIFSGSKVLAEYENGAGPGAPTRLSVAVGRATPGMQGWAAPRNECDLAAAGGCGVPLCRDGATFEWKVNWTQPGFA
jgi:YD repeat-containing protein